MTDSTIGSDVLHALRSGTRESIDRIVPLLYGELRQIAHRHLTRTRNANEKDATLVTTALVNEAYLKLVDQDGAKFNDRAHFLALASVAMRHILIDGARARTRHRRGGGAAQITFEDAVLEHERAPERLLELDDALTQLASVSPRLARVVEYRFYGGLSEAEIATVLSVTERTVQRDWAKARMLLRSALAD
jgi:RNA polymerase sigma factor (TIGR02999 family)